MLKFFKTLLAATWWVFLLAQIILFALWLWGVGYVVDFSWWQLATPGLALAFLVCMWLLPATYNSFKLAGRNGNRKRDKANLVRLRLRYTSLANPGSTEGRKLWQQIRTLEEEMKRKARKRSNLS